MKADAAGTKNTGTLAKKLRRDWNLNKWKYIMIIPVLIYLALFCYKPMYGLIIAFKDYKITRGIAGSSWADPWFKWFLNFITDPYFPRVIKNTFMISGLTILFGFPTPIILALLINEVRNKAFKRSVQTITYMPYFISTVVMCGIIKVFCMQDGLFAQIASAFGGVAENYLANPRYFRTIYVASDIWQKIGWDSIIYLAAISSVDTALYEAAEMDGCGKLKKMWHITLPGIRGTIGLLFIMGIGGLLSSGVDQIWLLRTPGNMTLADTLDVYVVRVGLQGGQFGYATAIGLIQGIVGLILVVISNKICKKITDVGLW